MSNINQPCVNCGHDIESHAWHPQGSIPCTRTWCDCDNYAIPPVSSTQPDVAYPSAMSRVDYLLSHFAQECCEVAVRCTKAQMFGLDEIQPEQEFTNRQRIMHELCDLLAIAELLRTENILPDDVLAVSEVAERTKAKKVKANHFSDYSRQLGRLEP